MSQDLYFIPLNDDVPGVFARAMVTGILSKGARKPVTCFCCEYPDGSHGEAHAIDDDPRQTTLDWLGFVHFGGRMMMERIYELADALPVFLVWTGFSEDDVFACVTRPERLALVREDAKDMTFAVARDPSHLNRLVKGSTFEECGW